MGRVLSAATIAVSLAIGLTAQEKVKERTKIDTDDAKVVTWVGCLRASADGFDLTEVTSSKSVEQGKGDDDKGRPRTPKMVMLRHVPAGLNLQGHVGRRVAVTGATEKDVFEDIEVKVKTERTAKEKPRPDRRTKTTTEVEADPSGHNILVPVSIEPAAGTCR